MTPRKETSVLYTLAKFFVWGLGFAAIGGAVGWLLRGIRCSRELAAAKRTTVDETEVERLRHRVANLEPIIADRETLRAHLAELEGQLKTARATAASADAPARGFAEIGDVGSGGEAEGEAASPGAAPVPFAGFAVDHDLAAAKAVMGSAVALDDLKIVEGIGPVLEGVLNAAGITTWAALGAATPDAIRAILVGADDRHRMHDPTTWPRQGRLAAIGEWEALKAFQDRLTAGRH